MLREILINLIYIVAILGLLSLAYCIIAGVIETQIDNKKRKTREQELDKMLEDFTNELIEKLKEDSEPKECCCKQNKKKKDTKKN